MIGLWALFGLGNPSNPLTASPTQNPFDAFLGWPGNPFALIPWYSRWTLWLLLLALAWVFWGVSLAYRTLWATWVLRQVSKLMQAMRRALVSLTHGTLGDALGTAHWSTRREIQATGLLREGPLPLARWRGKTLYEPQGGHVLVLGPPRSIKSYGVVMPALRAWEGNVIVSDLRGELYRETHQEREALGPTWRFDPVGLQSCNLDVLEGVRWGTPAQTADVQRLMHHLLRPRKAEEMSSFQRAAVPLLTAVAIHCHTLGRGSFPDISDWMLAPDRSREEKLRELLASPTKVVAEAARGVLDESTNLRSVVWNAALEPLALFQDEVIASRTRTSDLDWQRFLTGLDPTSLFLCTPFKDIGRLGPFMGAIVEMLTAILGSPDVTPRHKTLLLLDEAANLGYLDSLEQAVSFLAGSGTQVMAIFQNVPQFLHVYGPSSPLLASFATHVCYAPLPLDELTALWISRALGEKTVWSESVALGESASEARTTQVGGSLSTGGLGLSGGMGWSEGTGSTVLFGQSQTRRSLLLPDEVRRIGADVALVLAQNGAPVWAQKFAGPESAARQGWARLVPARFPVKTALASLAAVLLTLALWPLKPLVTPPPARQPLQPWEREAPMSTAMLRHRSGAPMNLEDRWRALREEASLQQHPRSLEDMKIGRKPQSLLDEEARQAQLAQVPAKAPAYRGSWVVRGRESDRPMLGHKLQMSKPCSAERPCVAMANWSWHPTEADCHAALETRTAPMLAHLHTQAEAIPDPATQVQVTRSPGRITWTRGAQSRMATTAVYWCEDRPQDAPGLQPDHRTLLRDERTLNPKTQQVHVRRVPSTVPRLGPTIDANCPDCR